MTDRTYSIWIAAAAACCLAFGWAASADAFTYVTSQCPNGAAWPNLPVPYKINRAGSDDLSFSKVREAVRRSYGTWNSPCCSTFQASYQGKTSQTALDVRRSRTADPVLSWIENTNNWPQYLGDPNRAIGVTLVSASRSCEIVQAPIVFNGIRFTYWYQKSGSVPRGETDFQSIATHEIGHFLGLGHTRSPQNATMYPAYLGGTRQRSLEGDDEKGVCDLYGGGTCNCQNDSDCASGETCTANGTCKDAPCQSDSDCAGSKVCDTGTGNCIVPPCSSDADCTRDGYVCNTSSGTCEPKCPTCQTCQSDSDCGSSSLTRCVQHPDGSRSVCIKSCPQGSCPGDSVCKRLRTQQGTYRLCMNPGVCLDSEQNFIRTFCPTEYTCGDGQCVNQCQVCSGGGGDDTGTGDPDAGMDTGGTSPPPDTGADSSGDGGSSASCPSLGRKCAPNCQSNCGPEADGRLKNSSGEIVCSCRCSSDSDCGTSGRCETRTVGGQQQKWCVPGSSPDAGSDDDVSISRVDEKGSNAACSCGASAESGRPIPGLAVLMFALAFVGLRRRRR